MAHDIFISHTSKDKAVADIVCTALEATGIRCWIAPRDIQPGKGWVESIVEAVRASKIVVLLFSESANQSKDVVNEITLAVNLNIMVLPVSIGDTRPSATLEYYLTSVYWLELTNPSDKMQINKIVKHTKALIK